MFGVNECRLHSARRPLSIAFQAVSTHTGVTAWLGSHTAGLGTGHVWHLPGLWNAQDCCDWGTEAECGSVLGW